MYCGGVGGTTSFSSWLFAKAMGDFWGAARIKPARQAGRLLLTPAGSRAHRHQAWDIQVVVFCAETFVFGSEI